MLNKIKSGLSQYCSTVKTKINSMTAPIKWVVYSYFGMVAMLVVTYYAAWLYQWNEGEVALGDLLSLIQEMVGASMVAFVTFIAGCLVDKDNDGIPDQFEEGDEK